MDFCLLRLRSANEFFLMKKVYFISFAIGLKKNGIIMKKLCFSLLVIFLALNLSGKAQLPAGLSLEEENAYQELISKPLGITPKDTTNTPPPFAVRTPAEFEPVEAVAIQWSSYEEDELHAFLVENIQLAGADVIIIIDGESGKEYIENYLENEGISLNKVKFITRSADSIWIRDYGPQTIYSFDGSKRALVDWEYNRPRPNDDVVPEVISGHLGTDLYRADENSGDNQIIFCGGNFMTDGFGQAFSSKLIQDENGGYNSATINRIASIMQNYHGIDSHVQMTELPYDGIHHIDMHLKLLDEETLLVGEYPDGVADGPQIEANLQFILDNYKTCYGTDYKVVRIPMPDDNGNYPNSWSADYLTHTNSLIVNNYVLVPTYNQSTSAENDAALDIYREAMPGYKVKGFDCSNIISRSGAIHCITHDVNKEKVLRLEAPKANDLVDSNKDDFTFKTNIWPYTEEIDSCFLYLKSPGESEFIKHAMNTLANDSNGFSYQPELTLDGEYEYYFKALSTDRVTGYKPQNAYAGGSYTFTVSNSSKISEEFSPKRFIIGKAYPNPFNPTTNLDYFIDMSTNVSLKIFNSNGQLMQEHSFKAKKGLNTLKINGDDLTSGIYIYQLKAEGVKEVKHGRIMLIK